MKRIVVLFLLLIYANIYSQQAYPNSVVFIPQGFSLQSLSSLGTSNIVNDISNISAVNPAAINEFNKISLGVSYQFQTKIDEAYIADIGYKRIQNLTPQAFGILVPFNEFKLGFGMRQRYNCGLDIGIIPITTMDQPDGTGEFIHPVYETVVHSYSLILDYSFSNTFNKGNDLSFGLRLDYNRLHQYEDLSSFSLGMISYSPSWEAGFIYTIRYEENRNLKFGVSYESNIEFTDISSFEGASITMIAADPNSVRSSSYYINYAFKGDIPGKLKIDFNLDPASNIKICTAINYIFWNSIADNISNQFEFSENFIYLPSSTISSSIGFYSTGRKFKQDYFGINNELNGFYFTAGLKIQFSYFDINLAAADSHLFSGDAYKQTIGTIGMGFQL